MNKILKYFRQPSPVYEKPWRLSLLAFLIIFFLFALFQPFNLNGAINKWLIIFAFSTVTGASILIVGYIFPLLFRRFYNPDKWIVGKNLINNFIILFVIGTGNFLLDLYIFNRPPEIYIRLFIQYQIITLLIGLIPASIVRYVVQNNGLKRNLREAQEMNRQLLTRLKDEPTAISDKSEKILLAGNTKESLELFPESIVYIESVGNYVNINYTVDNLLKQKQLRTTITAIQSTLEKFPYLIRCHRAFIVNTEHVIAIEGNVLGFQLTVNHTKNFIPVSRTYTKIIKERFSQI